MSSNSVDDKAFLSRLTSIVEANMKNEHFGVSELAQEYGKSRSYIHRRLKTLTGQSISQFIRTVRLQKAMKLLKENDISAAEVAYDVGFSSPAYFSHCFHEHYGFTPGEVKNRFVEFVSDEAELHSEIADFPDKSSDEQILKRKKSAYKKLILLAGLVIILVAGTWFFYFSRDLSIIVLPFENFSNNPESEHFTEGIREDILDDLQMIEGLRVLSRTSAEQFRNSSLSVKEIARKMKVKYVLEGSVRWHENEIRISCQLIDAFPFREDHVWSDSFNRKPDDFIGVQSEISLEVASNIKASVSEDEIKQIQKIPTQNSKAYNYYLQARFLHHKADSPQRSGFDRVGVTNCIQYYEKAIAEDENFAQAYAGLAKAWFSLSAWGFLNSNEGFLNARKLSLKALEIDPDCAQAHEVLGDFLIWGQRNFEEGGKELKTSIRLNPNIASSRQAYAQYLMITGPIEEARVQVNHAIELEPYFWVIQNLNSWIYYFEGKYEEALEACTIAYDYNPNFSSNDWLFVLNYAKLGKGEKMAEKLKYIAKRYSETDDYTTQIQQAYDKSGIEGLFQWMIDVNKNNPIRVEGLSGHPFFIAWWYAMLGNKDEAVFWLEKNMQAKHKLYHYFNLIATNPDFDLLRDNPRFLKIVDDIGLTPYYKRNAK
ncbi:helix-turn-helix domain-containing protein [Maribellus mangrovi]|uniref:helix-turn-helix domain-containing protein n=1 Tax=Maribellus mangrovi TaxID=3133146 RepID=UPI0030EE24F5